MTKVETVALISAITYSFYRNGPNGGHRECAENALEIYEEAERVVRREKAAYPESGKQG